MHMKRKGQSSNIFGQNRSTIIYTVTARSLRSAVIISTNYRTLLITDIV